jgi:hypothetical protein
MTWIHHCIYIFHNHELYGKCGYGYLQKHYGAHALITIWQFIFVGLHGGGVVTGIG